MTVDVRHEPIKMWRGLKKRRFKKQLLAITTAYAEEIAGFVPNPERAIATLEPLVSERWKRELEAIATLTGQSYRNLFLANLYYDAMKLISGPDVGCTAVALATPSGPVHARNLDWWTENGMLANYSMVVDFVGHPMGPYSIVAWPGYVGALSGCAPGRFAMTLNTVRSGEGFVAGRPVALLLREILEECATFEEALLRVSEATLCCDCLVLLTGLTNHQMVVVERTPTTMATREATDGVLVATNHYVALQTGKNTVAHNELTSTACIRYDRATELGQAYVAGEAIQPFDILGDRNVKMGLTVQHMVMQANTGFLAVRVPS